MRRSYRILNKHTNIALQYIVFESTQTSSTTERGVGVVGLERETVDPIYRDPTLQVTN